MKKYRYIVAAVCVLLGAGGIAGIYAMDQSQKNKDEIAKQQESEYQPGTEIDIVGLDDDTEEDDRITIPSIDNQVGMGEDVNPTETVETENDDVNEVESEVTPEEPVATPQEETLHFSAEKGLMWPIEGSTLLDYSMDATIYFPTLNQYQYNPAMVMAGDVNSKVYVVAKGKITDISTNEVTGCTVTQDLGDGYTAIYGQLKELNVEVGDTVESGQVVGYISEPTKYYSVEGSNVYFQMLKDGVPVDPESILP